LLSTSDSNGEGSRRQAR